MSISEPEYRAYMLRLWLVQDTAGSVWRASLQSVESGEMTGFACLDELVAFLQKMTTEQQAAKEAEEAAER